ncbi:MAG TPA: NAD(P)/FAD-dependent oxidoreductase [Chryseosolibacter sp.]|nr:NAD(P)/FAD-dependent oxidoreductase [Chryseosolibacter sp.]
MIYDLIVAGGGAAGFFAAIRAAEVKPGFRIAIVEKSPKLLAKVKISGGGRCNVTHSCFDPIQLSKHYPRGAKLLKHVFRKFQVKDVVSWFERKGVRLKAEEDGRMFPVTDDSQTIIDCFMREALAHKIKIEIANGIKQIKPGGNAFEITLHRGDVLRGRNVLIAAGGMPSLSSFDWIASLGVAIVPPLPSLFTFNDPSRIFADLMGLAVPEAEVRIAGTTFRSAGPVLITHWGLSGPAVIRLSAWAAVYLHSIQYKFTALVSWVGEMKETDLRDTLKIHTQTKGKQKVATRPLFGLPSRLWTRLCDLAGIPEEKIWAELAQKSFNKLVEMLLRCPFAIDGKTTFKEEFVTCGGVDLKEVDYHTMQSTKVKGLYFAGEVLNIDGETGGFNFQAAWSTAAVAAEAIATSASIRNDDKSQAADR